MKGLCFLFFLFLTPNIANAKILFRGDFESGKIFPLGETPIDSFFYGSMGPGCTPSNRLYSVNNDNRLVTSPVRAGKYANAQTIRRNCDYRSYNDDKYQKPRQELGIQPGVLNIQTGQERWVGFSVFVPKDYNYDPSENDMSVFQLKKLNNTTCCGFNIIAEGDRFLFSMVNYLDDQGAEVKDNALKQYSWPMTKEVWHDVVFHFRMCRFEELVTGCKPFMELYVNGSSAPVGIWRNANTTSTLGHEVKINVYKFGWNCTVNGPRYSGAYADAREDFSYCMTNPNPTNNPNTITFYFDELMVGDESSSLEEVAPHVYPVRNPPVSPTDFFVE